MREGLVDMSRNTAPRRGDRRAELGAFQKFWRPVSERGGEGLVGAKLMNEQAPLYLPILMRACFFSV